MTFYLTVSLVVLASALLAGRFHDRGLTVFLLAIATFLLSCLSIASLGLMVQALLLLLAGLFAQRWNWPYRRFAFYAVSGAMVGYVVVFAIAYVEANRYRELRESIACEPIANRLVPVRKSSGEKELKDDAKKRLDFLGDKLGRSSREIQLSWLHNQTLKNFVNSPGFGVGRTPLRPTQQSLALPEMADRVPQPAPFGDELWSDSAPMPAKTTAPGLIDLHLDGIVDFVNPLGFGYVTNDKQLFGFQPHHFRKLPRTDGWKVRSIELVSLLLHEDPRVYATTELPRMDKIRAVPTRSLDRFETVGLAELKTGEDFFTSETAHGVRMLGAIRSIDECIKCHGGERGDLLGAFSYVLKSEGASR